MSKEVKRLVAPLLKADAGFEIGQRGNGGHAALTYRGAFIAKLPATPGRGRWRGNLASQIRGRCRDVGGAPLEAVARKALR